MAQSLKRLPAMRETWVQLLGWEDPLEKEMAIHSSTLAWKILIGYSPWSRKESDTTERLHFHFQNDYVFQILQQIFLGSDFKHTRKVARRRTA